MRYRVRYRTPDNRQTDKRGFTTKRDAEAGSPTRSRSTRCQRRVRRAGGRPGEAGGVRAGVAGLQAQAEAVDAGPVSGGARYVRSPSTPTIALGDISRQLVREWVADLSVDLAPASVHKTVGVLRQVLAMAVAENRLVMNPGRRGGAALGDGGGAAVPDAWSSCMRWPTPLGSTGRWCTCWGRAGCGSGRSPSCGGEMSILRTCRLRIARSVTLVDGVFEIGSPKNGKGRTVSLPAFVADLLTPGQPDALVFPDSEGGHMRGTQRAAAVVVAGRRRRAELFPRTVTVDGELVGVRLQAARACGTPRRRWRSRPARTSRRCRTCSGTSPRG